MLTLGQVRDGASENLCLLGLGQPEDGHKELEGDLAQGKRVGEERGCTGNCQGHRRFS